MPSHSSVDRWNELAEAIVEADGGWVEVRRDPSYRRGGRVEVARWCLERRGLEVDIQSSRDEVAPHDWIVMARLRQ